jgi:transcription elongation factor GreB
MSRAFVKEDDSGQPPIIPPRAALPPGTSNYVTPLGIQLLRKELADLETRRANIEANHQDEAERTRQLTIVTSQIAALTQRLATARVIDPRNQPPGQVRFGATVTLLTINGRIQGKERYFTIVGVDEASVAEGKVAFVAPIAIAVLGKRVGESFSLRMGPEEEIVKVTAITY